VLATLDVTVDLSGRPLRCLRDGRHSTLFVLLKEGGSWMVEVLHTWSYVAGMAVLGNESIP
jgi:hypothetical protein